MLLKLAFAACLVCITVANVIYRDEFGNMMKYEPRKDELNLYDHRALPLSARDSSYDRNYRYRYLQGGFRGDDRPRYIQKGDYTQEMSGKPLTFDKQVKDKPKLKNKETKKDLSEIKDAKIKVTDKKDAKKAESKLDSLKAENLEKLEKVADALPAKDSKKEHQEEKKDAKPKPKIIDASEKRELKEEGHAKAGKYDKLFKDVDRLQDSKYYPRRRYDEYPQGRFGGYQRRKYKYGDEYPRRRYGDYQRGRYNGYPRRHDYPNFRDYGRRFQEDYYRQRGDVFPRSYHRYIQKGDYTQEMSGKPLTFDKQVKDKPKLDNKETHQREEVKKEVEAKKEIKADAKKEVKAEAKKEVKAEAKKEVKAEAKKKVESKDETKLNSKPVYENLFSDEEEQKDSKKKEIKKDAEEKSKLKHDPTRRSPLQSDPTKRSPLQSDPTQSSPLQNDPTQSSPLQNDPTKRSPSQRFRQDPTKNAGFKRQWRDDYDARRGSFRREFYRKAYDDPRSLRRLLIPQDTYVKKGDPLEVRGGRYQKDPYNRRDGYYRDAYQWRDAYQRGDAYQRRDENRFRFRNY